MRKAVEITLTNGEKRVIGLIIGKKDKKQFVKNVKKSVHLYWMLNAWAIDAKVFNDILKGQVDEIVVNDKETKQEYMVTPRKFEKYGIVRTHSVQGTQIFLPLHYWHKTNTHKNQTELSQWN